MESKLGKLWAIPQTEWMKRRKFTYDLLKGMEENGEIKLLPYDNVTFKLLNITVFTFKYKNQDYYFFEQRVNRNGQEPLIEFFQLERRVTSINGVDTENIHSSTILIGSDDDRQNTFYPLIQLAEAKG